MNKIERGKRAKLNVYDDASNLQYDKIDNPNGITGMFEGVPISLCKCGSEPAIYDSYFTFAIYCSNCNKYFTITNKISPPSWSDKQETIEQWNKMVRN